MSATKSPLTVHPRKPGDPQPDLTLYTVAHRAMQRGAHDLASLAERLRAGDDPLTRDRARALATYVGMFCDDVHLHHHGEDTIGWPIIAASAGDNVDLAPLSADHDELDPMLDDLRTAAQRLRADQRDLDALQTLAVQAVALRDMLDEHIGEEERDVFPVIREYVSAQDLARWEQAVMAGYPKGNLWFLIPWSVQAIPAAEVSATLARTPLAFRIAYRLFRGRYERLNRRLID